jgi:uncharacterized protein involved in tolerance to divalent cations
MIGLNGKGKLVGTLAAIASGCLILTALWSYYLGWEAKIEQSVTAQRMLNSDDETLKEIVPKVEACHAVNERQGWDIERNSRDISALTEQVKQTNEMMQTYFQAMMKEGRIPR